jgi:hypothetical protein
MSNLPERHADAEESRDLDDLLAELDDDANPDADDDLTIENVPFYCVVTWQPDPELDASRHRDLDKRITAAFSDWPAVEVLARVWLVGIGATEQRWAMYGALDYVAKNMFNGNVSYVVSPAFSAYGEPWAGFAPSEWEQINRLTTRTP